MRDMDHEHLRQLLVGCLKCGSMMTLTYESLQNVNLEAIFKDTCFPKAVMNKAELFKEDVWSTLLRPDAGDPPPHEFLPRDDFALCVVVKDMGGAEVGEEFGKWFVEIQVGETPSGGGGGAKGGGGEDAVEAALGAKEVKRNSGDMVEFAFDGELDEVKALIEKGFYIDSVDGRKHTPLSDACAQGHMDVAVYLLELGADPNSKSDLGRTPMWRAAYNGHHEMVDHLLKAGGDPTIPTSDFERPFDVAKNDETRAVLSEWPEEETARLMAVRAEKMQRALEERLKTAAEREAHAREVMRAELVALARDGKTDDVKAKLMDLVDTATMNNERPRVTANTARDERGATLLHIAAQHGHMDLLDLLVNHHKTVDSEFTMPGDESMEAKVFYTNVNRRDAKGWSPLAVAVFHDQKKATNRATKGCFNVTSTRVFSDLWYQKKHSPYENLRRDDHPSKNEPKRVETGRDMSLQSCEFRTLLLPRPRRSASSSRRAATSPRTRAAETRTARRRSRGHTRVPNG